MAPRSTGRGRRLAVKAGIPAVIVRRFAGALPDLAPIFSAIAFFQIMVLQQPFPELGQVLVGAVCVVLGLVLFIRSLKTD
ncbi:MAG: DUF1538 family protein, partial [Alphaproteobacteria bacterium]|nr:DUF1538 family protein [Alphaproteobacteria bacterium]